jgi:signal transduction histidine kinase
MIRLTVADHGEGMTDEVRERMFDPFFTTRALGHVGLGLTAVHALVQEAGGSIRVDTAPGQGTAVHVLWPAVDEDDVDVDVDNGSAAAADGLPPGER